MRTAIVAALVMLASCSALHATLGTGATTGSGTTATPTEPAAGGDGDLVVPDLIGKTAEEADAIVKQAGFTEGVESSRPVECDDAPEVEGKINCQIPEPGKRMKRYTLIQINVYKPQKIVGAIVKSQILQLLGKTPDEARRLLKSFGHTGNLAIQPSTDLFYPDCHAGRICDWNIRPAGRAYGASVSDDIILYTQKELPTAAAPPP